MTRRSASSRWRALAIAACIGPLACGGDLISDPPPRDQSDREPLVATISGIVRDRVTWLPIAGARVEAEGIVAWTTADGTYELVNLRMPVTVMVASQDGYETLSTAYPLASGTNVRLITLKPLVSRGSTPP